MSKVTVSPFTHGSVAGALIGFSGRGVFVEREQLQRVALRLLDLLEEYEEETGEL